MNILKQREATAKIESRCGAMTNETKNFIQKICYKKSASIDMTQYGFIRDCKVRPINLMLKPLQEQLEKIWEDFSLHTKFSRNPKKDEPDARLVAIYQFVCIFIRAAIQEIHTVNLMGKDRQLMGTRKSSLSRRCNKDPKSHNVKSFAKFRENAIKNCKNKENYHNLELIQSNAKQPKKINV